MITILLGIAGAIVGGFVGRLLGLYGPNRSAGFLMALLGAVLLLLLYRMIGRSNRVISPPSAGCFWGYQADMAFSNRRLKSSAAAGRGDSFVTRCCGSVPSTSAGISADE